MKNFRINQVRLPKYLAGTPKNGILLQYNGPLYYEILELIQKDPEVYNKSQIAAAKRRNPHSEVVIYTDANGNLRSTTNTGSGFVSGTDPIFAEIVAGIVLGKPLEWFGKTALWGLGKAGNNWARAKLISREMKEVKTPIVPGVTKTELVYLPVKQQSGKTSLKFYERPESKLTEAERAGIPKGERNLPMNKVESQHSASNSLYEGTAKDNRTFIPPTDKKYYFQLFGDLLQMLEFNEKLADYVKGLPDADDMFLHSNGRQSAYVHDFRKYLYNIGYDLYDISDDDLAKLLSLQYKDLSSTMTGKTKGMVVWHGSPIMFDAFDLSKTGSYTGNMGMGGPGNYFSNSRANYGVQPGGSIFNMLPYLINGIQSTPRMTVMKEKGLLPRYISPPYKRDFSSAEGPYLEHIKKLLEVTPTNDSKLYIDDFSMLRPGTLDPVNGLLSEYMLRRNDGIKSLFPHPSTFVRNADGSVSVRRDWGDSRVNYKTGGKLIKRK